MNINIISVGKIKESFITDGIKEYSKRIRTSAKLNIIQVADEKTVQNMTVKQENIIKGKEAARIDKYLNDNSYKIALAIEGKSLSSEDLAGLFNKKSLTGNPNITFIIGGSIGLADSIKNKCHMLLSFSAMTFPHQLMRLILVEQIYRAFEIMRGSPYHK